MYHTSQQIWSNRYLNWETTVADDQSDAISSQNLFDFSWFFACWWDVAFVWFSTHQLSTFSCVGRKSSWFSAQGHFKNFWIFFYECGFLSYASYTKWQEIKILMLWFSPRRVEISHRKFNLLGNQYKNQDIKRCRNDV